MHSNSSFLWTLFQVIVICCLSWYIPNCLPNVIYSSLPSIQKLVPLHSLSSYCHMLSILLYSHLCSKCSSLFTIPYSFYFSHSLSMLYPPSSLHTLPLIIAIVTIALVWAILERIWQLISSVFLPNRTCWFVFSIVHSVSSSLFHYMFILIHLLISLHISFCISPDTINMYVPLVYLFISLSWSLGYLFL